MDFEELKDMIEGVHLGHPQRQGLAKLHLDSLEYAMNGLASLGHRLHVEFLGAPPVVMYPKMLYKKAMPERIVHGSDEENLAKEAGYQETPFPADAV